MSALTRKGRLILAAAALLLLAGCFPAQAPAPAPPPPAPRAAPEPLAETAWLSQHLKDPELRIVDLRTAASYPEGHIPGSVNLLIAALDDPDNPVKGMILPREKMEALLGDLGISNDTTVVAVDEMGGANAARFFWSLEYYGHDRVRLLNGGFNKWQKEGKEVTRAVPKVARARFTARPDATRMATKEQVLQSLGKGGVAILDTRSPREYSGQDVLAKRGGHIPGAVNVNWANNLSGGDVPVLKPLEELRKLYEGAGITRDKTIIVYCQIGLRSTHTYLVLRLLGYEKVMNYDGSWSEWGNEPDTPVEK